jgi:thioesterase domain-containing protein
MALAIAHSLICRASLQLFAPYAAPDGELEVLIADIFAEVLSLDQVGANDDFHDLGGDSLLGEVLSMRISEGTGCELEISTLVDHGSPRRIAELLRAKAGEAVPPSTERIRPPIFIVHGRLGFTLLKSAFRQGLAETQRVRMFELPGIRGGRCYERIEDVAAVYVAQVAAEYPEGPILLAAFCSGGLIALEMSAQLAEMGRPVSQLVLLDPPVRRDGNLGVERGGNNGRLSLRANPKDWVKAKLRGLRAIPTLVRQTYSQDPDFADDELRYRRLLLRKKRKGSLKYSEFRFSVDAQAKLHAAFLRYSPRPYHGPVTILSSSKRDPALRQSHISDLLPQRRVQLVTERHIGIGGETAAARLMQEVFDAGLSQD